VQNTSPTQSVIKRQRRYDGQFWSARLRRNLRKKTRGPPWHSRHQTYRNGVAEIPHTHTHTKNKFMSSTCILSGGMLDNVLAVLFEL